MYDGYRVIGTCKSMGVVYCAVMTFVREEKKRYMWTTGVDVVREMLIVRRLRERGRNETRR